MNSREKASLLIHTVSMPTPTHMIEAITGLLDQHAEEQRQLCADAVEELYHNNADATLSDEYYIHACLNAGGD